VKHIDARGGHRYDFARYYYPMKESRNGSGAGGVKVVGSQGRAEGFLGTIGVRFMIDGSEAGERFSLVEHPISPRAIAAPLHSAHARG
jgi:hypothetical protein